MQVRRTQAHQPPIPTSPLQLETLTDVIESALRAGGPDSLEAGWTDPNAPGQKLDVLV